MLLFRNTPRRIQEAYNVTVVKGRCVMLFKQVRVNHVDDSVAPENRRRRISFSIPLIKSANLAIAIPTTQPPTIDQNPIQPASIWLTCTGVKIKSRTPDQPANTPSGMAYAKAIIKNLKLLSNLQKLRR